MTETGTETGWKERPELQQELKQSRYYVADEMAEQIIDEFESSGGFGNQELEKPLVKEPMSSYVAFYKFKDKEYAVKLEREDAYEPYINNVHGDQIFAEKNQVDHVAPMTFVNKGPKRYAVQLRIHGELVDELDTAASRKAKEEAVSAGIFIPDFAGNVVIEKGTGNWVVVDTGGVMSAEELNELKVSFKTEKPDGFFDEFKDRQ